MKQSDTTATSLTRAATRLFADHGFDGASVRAITRAAQANLGAVTYHFGTKRGLYEAVLEQATTPLVDAALHAAAQPGTPGQRVAAVVRAYFEILAGNPDIARLMMQDFVIGNALAVSTAVPIRNVLMTLSALVAEGQAAGEFRTGDPRLMAISIISQPVHMTLVRTPLKALGVADFDDPQTREHLIQHMVAFACAGLANGDRP